MNYVLQGRESYTVNNFGIEILYMGDYTYSLFIVKVT